jgi:anti-sigma factor RsiW
MATMLDCKKIQPQISEFIDGALDGDSAWAIKLHLASCSVCTLVADDLTRTIEVLRSLPDPAISAGFEAALARRLADQVLQPRRPSLLQRVGEWWAQPQLRPAFASVAALAAIIPASFFIASRSVGPKAGQAGSHTAAATDPSLDQMWNEHLSYASSEPLADSAGMLQAHAGPANAPVPGDPTL